MWYFEVKAIGLETGKKQRDFFFPLPECSQQFLFGLFNNNSHMFPISTDLFIFINNDLITTICTPSLFIEKLHN